VKVETGGGNKLPEPVSALTTSPGGPNELGSIFYHLIQYYPHLLQVVKVETGGGNKLPEPVSEMLSEPKQALAIYFHRRFRLSQPAGDVGSIVLNGKKLNPTHLAHPEMLSEPKPALAIYFHRRFRLSLPARDVGIKLKGENPILT
jgi:hypothetical protein